MRRVIAIVPSAGIGRRFGQKKPFHLLGGKPLIIRTIEVLESVNEIVEIIPVLRKEDIKRGIEVFKSYNISKTKRIATGGKERQDSVYNALKLINDENCIVLIHDGARPFVEKGLIEKAIKELKGFDGVITGIPLNDTIKEVGEGIVRSTLKRDFLWAIQTPQVFSFKKLFDAYEMSIKDGFYSTDDSALVERYGGKIKVIFGSYRNIKITTPDDMIFAEYLLSKNKI
ncbi:MAG: 2-C-methyl-D-erythritol 4-phosphate cytidylyltransferase [Nitrospirae bacterium]|nr:2-C-methyl-D-erythritol 4-phosphate cytidylyltransferase [Nitrospirota bacterium]